MALTKVIGDGLGGTNSLTIDTDTLIVDSTNDSVGINVASPNSYYATDLVVGVGDNGGITILNSGTTHAGCIMFADGTGTSAYRGQIVYDHNDDSIGMWTAATNAMRIDSTGAMTKPNQPAFLAHPSSSQNNIPINGATTVAFGTERFDQNSDFNTSNSTFTAPVTGKYQLQFTATYNSVDPATDYIEHLLITSNRNYQIVLDPDGFDSSPLYHTFNICVLADMDAGDTANINIGMNNSGSSQMDISTSTFFSGYLVC